MKNKTVENLVIATVTLLGASYILEKYMINKKRKQMIEQAKAISEAETEVVSERKYIYLSGIYRDVVNNKIEIKNLNSDMKEAETEQVSDFSLIPKRKYHILKK